MMKKSELHVGDRVAVMVSGYMTPRTAVVIDTAATPGKHDRPTATIRIRFEPGEYTFLRERNVAPARIVGRR